ncbi:hypothetical protein CCP3SC15_950010 [Gammaproteobacteria bacterium]
MTVTWQFIKALDQRWLSRFLISYLNDDLTNVRQQCNHDTFCIGKIFKSLSGYEINPGA